MDLSPPEVLVLAEWLSLQSNLPPSLVSLLARLQGSLPADVKGTSLVLFHVLTSKFEADWTCGATFPSLVFPDHSGSFVSLQLIWKPWF